MGSKHAPFIKTLRAMVTSKIRTLMFRTHFQMLSHASQRVSRNLTVITMAKRNWRGSLSAVHALDFHGTYSNILAGSLAVFSCLVQRSSSESTGLSSSILHNQKRWVERIFPILCQNIQYNHYSITLSEAKMTYKEYFQDFPLVYP